MFTKWFYILACLAFCIVPLNWGKVHPTIQLKEVIECSIPGKIVNDLLPTNLRILQAPKYDSVGYALINPQNGNSIPIPGTEFPGAILLSQDELILFLREITPRQVEWMVMDVNGSDAHIVRQNSEWPTTRIISEDHLLLLENELVSHEVFSLQDETFSPITYPEPVDFVPGNQEFNADATRIAYKAYQRDDNGSLEYGEPYVIRIQDRLDGEYVDIKPTNWEKSIVNFYWSDTTNLITAEVEGLGEYLEIFDANNGNLLSQVTPPDIGYQLSASVLSWSPDRQQFAIEWNIHYDILIPNTKRPYESILAIYDLDVSPELVSCFMLPGGAYDVNNDGLGTYRWSSDGNLIWWLACPTIDSTCPEQYNLMLIDLDANLYGDLAEKVNIFTLISFSSDLDLALKEP